MFKFQISNFKFPKLSYLLLTLFLIVLLKQIIWMGMIPIWHFPDEQAHFAQVQNIAQFGLRGVYQEGIATTSDEIINSEIILDTYRDGNGRNKYTFHPEHNLIYTDTYQGLWEDLLNELKGEYALEKGGQEATLYPFLYYLLGSASYQFFAQSSIITRVFAVRFVSVLIFSLGLVSVYLLGKKIFPQKLWTLALSIMVIFQPMYSFVGAGVTSDVLFNTLFSFFLLASIMLIEKFTLKRLLLMLTIIILGSLAKQQMLIAILMLPIIFIPHYAKIGKVIIKYKLVSLLTLISFGAGIYGISLLGEFEQIFEFISSGKYIGDMNQLTLVEHIRWTLIHTYREILPWYWGIFKWLGVTIPRWVHRVQMSLIAGAILGNLIYLSLIVRKWFKSRLIKKENIYILYLYFAAFFYFGALMMWDYFFRRAYGFSFGMQGRYYFPLIASHMVFLLVGWRQLGLLGFKRLHLEEKFITFLPLGLSIWWLILHSIGLMTAAKSYYDLSSLNSFIIQVSQYKPLMFKGGWWFLWSAGYVLCNLVALRLLIKTSLQKHV